MNGISQGCVYILLASGLTLVLGILNVPNFAQGHLYMIAAYLGFYMVMSYGMNYWLALVLATFAMGVLGQVIYSLVFYRMRSAPEVNLFVAAMALLMVLEGIALYFFGASTKWFLIPFTRRVITFAGLAIP
ncbi:MAG: branched-chain amino acid ABC transporter permease, partial [Desulfobacterales bacterium]|nr:branched-chain amino acid ABC transporter permease [Desulfobacterales bacterium]